MKPIPPHGLASLTAFACGTIQQGKRSSDVNKLGTQPFSVTNLALTDHDRKLAAWEPDCIQTLAPHDLCCSDGLAGWLQSCTYMLRRCIYAYCIYYFRVLSLPCCAFYVKGLKNAELKLLLEFN